MVHENYLKIFRDMDAACRAIKYSSDSDTMISEFRERDLTLPMALSTITRGFMTCSATANRKWMPLTNQENASVRKRTQALKDIAINIDPKYILIPRDASMDILPIICPEYSVKKSSHRYVDSELCISDEEELSISDGNKRLKTNIYTDANYFSNSKSKINERGLTEEDEILGCYKIEEIQSDSESEVNCQVEWEDEDVEFLENLDI
ncbi:hypothetical protein L9F63_010556 [Diploptera punctata]|uniref:Uncharacterized protein n=1 Tax=Diploptera punctata TaxID=6984 RepID=A0AAD8ERD1_DIPPU|nr:hypothetical protein L9F63_010556 [Diploptera punctata]